jgi:hypothetical protein
MICLQCSKVLHSFLSFIDTLENTSLSSIYHFEGFPVGNILVISRTFSRWGIRTIFGLGLKRLIFPRDHDEQTLYKCLVES